VSSKLSPSRELNRPSVRPALSYSGWTPVAMATGVGERASWVDAVVDAVLCDRDTGQHKDTQQNAYIDTYVYSDSAERRRRLGIEAVKRRAA